MDKQARKLTAPREDGAPSEAGSEGGSNEESDHDDKVAYTFFLMKENISYHIHEPGVAP